MRFLVKPGGVLQGQIRVPGDKSISHRSVIFGAVAEGVTEISGFLEGEDTLATAAALRQMGVEIERDGDCLRIHGVGLHGLQAPSAALDLGNSGTSMRLLCGLLAGQSFDCQLTGDASLRQRPMTRVTAPLSEMGAQVEAQTDGTPPINITGGQSLHGIDYGMPMASAQVKSCVLLAGLYAAGRTCVTEPAPTRDHTERMLEGFGYAITRHGATVCLQGGGKLQAAKIEVPADISSAAFFMVGASIAAGSEVILRGVGVNPTRTGVIDILRLMGADIVLRDQRDVCGEPVADIVVRSAPLRGIRIPEALVPLAIDEFPAIFVAAACAEGETVLTGAEELRVKESDRIQGMADGLHALGVAAEPTVDGIIIQGGMVGGGSVLSHGDHRIAMALAVAGLVATGPIEILDCDHVETSFPGFAALAAGAGLGIEVT